MVEKKITSVKGEAKKTQADTVSIKVEEKPTWQVSPENKAKATKLRVFAAISWILALVAQAGNIYYITHAIPVKIWIPLLIIAVDAAFAILGGYLWKKSNHMDPPSEANKFLFYMQSQLALIVAVIAFLPLVIFVFTDKNLDKKQKGIIGGVAILAMVIVGVAGVDFNPPSQEKYAAQAQVVEALTGQDLVYGTKSGTKYHLYSDCQYLKGDNVKDIFEGSVADLHANNHKIGTDKEALCSVCRKKAMKAKNWTEDDLGKAVEDQKQEYEEKEN